MRNIVVKGERIAMKLLKKGRICSADTFDLNWYKKNSMVPLPYLISPNTIRIFLTMCDGDNVGRIGYVDVEAQDPSKVIGYSRYPVLGVGQPGSFDDNGVVGASLLKDGNKLYLYYSGYQTCVKVPYLIFAGVAVSLDNGRTFEKLTKEVPMLDRVPGECSTRCAAFIMKCGSVYKTWYTASTRGGWCVSEGRMKPLYNLKYKESRSPIIWDKTPGETVIDFKNSDEHGICRCCIWREDGIFKIIYSLRHLSIGYRLGYAESKDGIKWERLDDKVGITVSSKGGFDDDMVCFGERMQYKDRVYLFYSGNHYGMSGIGYAELVEK